MFPERKGTLWCVRGINYNLQPHTELDCQYLHWKSDGSYAKLSPIIACRGVKGLPRPNLNMASHAFGKDTLIRVEDGMTTQWLQLLPTPAS